MSTNTDGAFQGGAAKPATYVLFLEVPGDFGVMNGPVTVTWPATAKRPAVTIEAGVLGAHFVSPAEFAREQEANMDFHNTLERIAAAESVWHTCTHSTDAAEALARATGATP